MFYNEGRGPFRRVLRGGSWNNNTNNLRCANRNNNEPTNTNNNIGFRCAQDTPWLFRYFATKCQSRCACQLCWLSHRACVWNVQGFVPALGATSTEYKTSQRRVVSLSAEPRSWGIWSAMISHYQRQRFNRCTPKCATITMNFEIIRRKTRC